MLMYCSSTTASVHWTGIIDNSEENLAFRIAADTSSARVTALANMQRFEEMFNRCSYAALSGTAVNSEDDWFSYLGNTTSVGFSPEEDNAPVYEIAAPNSTFRTSAKNICFVDSAQYQRTVVAGKDQKGSILQALAYDENGYTQSQGVIASPAMYQSITASLISNDERRMLLCGNGTREKGLQQIDLESGQVVQEFVTGHDDYNIYGATYSNHSARLSDQVVTCISSNVAFDIDTRLDPRRCLIAEDPSAYALGSLKTTFSCHATSEKGHLAIGDGNGSIRLYEGAPGSRVQGTNKTIPKTAKTLLETRTPIRALSMTANGDYLLTTCDKVLYLLPTKYTDDAGKELDGYTSRMGKKKPAPIRLVPSPHQIMQMGGEGAIHFTSATFGTVDNKADACITACCGRFVLTWDLQNVIKASETNRLAVCGKATMDTPVLSLATRGTGTSLTLMTEENVSAAPVHRTMEKVQGFYFPKKK
ncbi:vacuole import and degradation [Strigomonas culicis]|uniref:Vacuole import and degradation n=1 Tax=Strigomonas culicis TaxID=28005 RepID=S9TW39_9TRYP|nr:vacuole import and degradation [Strigomonas culicis]EPY29456.1 vacuole import and degradation [Strigomonas culicis]|eukprot:EPY20818.1 vacuole import and degradation [Strigomonas culicis]